MDKDFVKDVITLNDEASVQETLKINDKMQKIENDFKVNQKGYLRNKDHENLHYNVLA